MENAYTCVLIKLIFRVDWNWKFLACLPIKFFLYMIILVGWKSSFYYRLVSLIEIIIFYRGFLRQTLKYMVQYKMNRHLFLCWSFVKEFWRSNEMEFYECLCNDFAGALLVIELLNNAINFFVLMEDLKIQRISILIWSAWKSMVMFRNSKCKLL